jgi:hypothetical protein
MSSHKANIEKLTSIISKTNGTPTIINESSKFVVVTYWWGRGNYNQNTARPCISYYEGFIQKGIKFITKSVNSMYISRGKNVLELPSLVENAINKIGTLDTYRDYINSTANIYMNTLYKFCNVKKSSNNAESKLIECLTNKKRTGDTPSNFVYKSKKNIAILIHKIIKEVVLMNKNEIASLIKLESDVIELKEKFNQMLKDKNRNQIKINEIKQEIDSKISAKNISKKQIVASLKKKTRLQSFPKYNKDVNVFDILNDELRYQSPLKFEEMIEKWERICTENKCNYLTIEYPEFAQPGGYQLAINAKPLFIKKALELCPGRAVVYIDGDMFVRKYPMIFDIQDVDFMARGWWMDPRAGGNFVESIVYDPYMFETSGGIMYFSQSKNSKFLIDKWITVSEMVSQAGKADDRILSLVFNSYKLLLGMKIIQLPIEYLWLTLRYDEPLLEYVYYNNEKAMTNSIIVEHPECLTSEETAAGAGASSDRTPKYYDFIGEEHIVPVSEMFHEYLMFPNKEMTYAFEDYFKYMKSITYIDDGSEYLIKKKLVNPEDPDYNESPLYIVPFDKKLGDKASPEDESYTYNDISTINLKRAAKMRVSDIPIIKKISDNVVEIKDDGSYSIKEHELISLIIRLIVEKKTVIYNPVKDEDYDIKYYDKLVRNLDSLYSGLEFVFVPYIKNDVFSDFFKPGINTSQVMMFRGGNSILTRFLSMFLSFEAFSSTLQYGSYEFMSRVSVGYIKKDKNKVKPDIAKAINKLTFLPYTNTYLMNNSNINKYKPVNKGILSPITVPITLKGGNNTNNTNNNKINKFMSEYEYGLDEISGYTSGGGKYRKNKTYKSKKYNKVKKMTRKAYYV